MRSNREMISDRRNYRWVSEFWSRNSKSLKSRDSSKRASILWSCSNLTLCWRRRPRSSAATPGAHSISLMKTSDCWCRDHSTTSWWMKHELVVVEAVSVVVAGSLRRSSQCMSSSLGNLRRQYQKVSGRWVRSRMQLISTDSVSQVMKFLRSAKAAAFSQSWSLPPQMLFKSRKIQEIIDASNLTSPTRIAFGGRGNYRKTS